MAKVKMNSAKNVERGYLMYCRLLRDKVLELFEYENLPSSLPYKEIESRLTDFGFCGIFNHKKYGLVTSNGGISGVDIYNHATRFVYAQPILGSGTLLIDKDCVVVYNSYADEQTQTGFTEIIERYARQLADIDCSISVGVVNTRLTNVYRAKDDNSNKRYVEFFNKLERGEYSAIIGQDIGVMKDIELIGDNASKMQNNLADLMSLRRDVLANFYEELGVQHKRDKVAEMTAFEVGESDETLLVNQKSLLEERQKGMDKINEMFGTDIIVHYREGVEV